MNRKEINDKLIPLARKAFSKENIILSDELDASMVDTWTSLSFMQFLTLIEAEFGMKFSIMELLKMQNIGGIVDVIESKQ